MSYESGKKAVAMSFITNPDTGPEPAILDWYGHCKLGPRGVWGPCSPRKIFKIRHSEIVSEAMLGPKCY